MHLKLIKHYLNQIKYIKINNTISKKAVTRRIVYELLNNISHVISNAYKTNRIIAAA